MTNEPLAYGRHYHIYNRGNNGENLFVEPRNYTYFLQLYAKHIQPVADTFAYCLLPNHFHFAIRTFTEAEQEAYRRQIGLISRAEFKSQPPSRAFNNFFIAYARAFNKATGRTGSLFERPFGRKVVDNRRYFLALIRYIHRNPQHHGLVADFREWPWSTFDTLLSDQPTRLRRDDVLAWFDGRGSLVAAHDSDDYGRFEAPLRLEDWY